MLSVGIIWNSVQEYSDEILNDIGERVNLIESFNLELGNKYNEFVDDMYLSENMEPYKIDIKKDYMGLYNETKVTVVVFDFDESKQRYHDRKKKNVYSELEDLKMFIRKKYSTYIDKYTFDIVFHASDNNKELIEDLKIIRNYISKDNKTEKDYIRRLEKEYE